MRHPDDVNPDDTLDDLDAVDALDDAEARDIALVTDLILGDLSPADEAAVRRRMDDDLAFRELARPLILLYSSPPLAHPTPLRQEKWETFSKRIGAPRSDFKTGAFLDDAGKPLPLRWWNNLDWRVRWANVAGAVSLGFKIAVIAVGLFLIARGVSNKRNRPALGPSAAMDTTTVAPSSPLSRRIGP